MLKGSKNTHSLKDKWKEKHKAIIIAEYKNSFKTEKLKSSRFNFVYKRN